MIPTFGPSGVLPPFTGSSPADRTFVSPYPVSMSQLVQRFGTSGKRIEILMGLISYRAALANIGIVDGFQWIDGSFVEDCERNRGRPPEDVDIVTFAYRPQSQKTPADWATFIGRNIHLFDTGQIRRQYSCDAYFIDLEKPPHICVMDTAYFNGLFSHQRDTAQWKGMVAIDLKSDDADALSSLGGLHA